MSERKHGRRYTFKEKRGILDYLEKHTYKDTSERFEISETTLSRWRKEMKSGSNTNKTKIIVSLPKFWLEFLNEQIETDVWEDYSDAFLSILRDYFRNRTSKRKEDAKYLDNAKAMIPKLLELRPSYIDSMLLASSNEVLYKTKGWGSSEGIIQLIKSWKKLNNDWKKNMANKIKEISFQNNTYSIRDISVKHLICAPKAQNLGFLLLLKRKSIKDDVFIFAKTKELRKYKVNIGVAMNTLKKAAIGVHAPKRELIPDDYLERAKARTVARVPDPALKKEMEIEWKRVFQIKTNPLLMRLATQVNKPLKTEEKEVLNALERQLGRKIERITADPDQEVNKYDIIFYSPGKLPWAYLDMNFPAPKFPRHYIALNGNIILMVLSNLAIFKIPSQLSNLTNLIYLNLNSNIINELPEAFLNQKSIEYLFLENNQFTKIPESIIELPKLQMLSMQNNKISQIPVALTQRFEKYKLVFPKSSGECRLDFSGNKVTHDSLSKEQQELVRQLILYI
ncbi:MAG: leucine-rich repeat domain-containing protein [Promethearchaeota archaeon]